MSVRREGERMSHLTLSKQSGLLPQILKPHSEPLHNLGKHFRQGICMRDPEVHFLVTLVGKNLLNRHEPALFSDQSSVHEFQPREPFAACQNGWI